MPRRPPLRILLDENLPRQLAPLLVGHECQMVVGMGWGGVKNGKLLALAEKHFDVFITVDKGFAHEQNLAKFNLAIFLLRASRNSLKRLQPLVPAVIKAAHHPKKRALTIFDTP
jgi:hypothetical protein